MIVQNQNFKASWQTLGGLKSGETLIIPKSGPVKGDKPLNKGNIKVNRYVVKSVIHLNKGIMIIYKDKEGKTGNLKFPDSSVLLY